MSTISASTTSTTAYKVTADTTGNLVIQTGSGPTTALTIDTAQNMGLGVTPLAWDAIWRAQQIGLGGSIFARTANNDLWISSNTYANSSVFKYINPGYGSAYVQTQGQHQWYNAPSGTAGATATLTQAMTLDASGNLLVGTTSQIGVEQVGISFADASKNGLGIQTQGSTSGAGFIAFRNSSGTNIGSVARVAATNAVVYNTTSDYRLKTVVGAVTGQGERIDALKPVDYQWKDGGQNARGFLAHEFAEVYANSVTGAKDAVDADGNPLYQSMQASTPEVIADLVAEIQSLRQRLAALENK